MNYYDLVVAFDLKVGDSKDEAEGELKKYLPAGAKELKIDVWGKKTLAYPIKRKTEAVFVKAVFGADPKGVSTVDSSLRLSEDVLRHLLIRTQNSKVQS